MFSEPAFPGGFFVLQDEAEFQAELEGGGGVVAPGDGHGGGDFEVEAAQTQAGTQAGPQPEGVELGVVDGAVVGALAQFPAQNGAAVDGGAGHPAKGQVGQEGAGPRAGQGRGAGAVEAEAATDAQSQGPGIVEVPEAAQCRFKPELGHGVVGTEHAHGQDGGTGGEGQLQVEGSGGDGLGREGVGEQVFGAFLGREVLLGEGHDKEGDCHYSGEGMHSTRHAPTLTHLSAFCKFAFVMACLLVLIGCQAGKSGPLILPVQSPLERSAPLGVITSMYCRVLDQTGERGAVAFMLRGGDIVKILQRSAEREQWGGTLDFWYRVERDGGDAGWVFGSTIRLCADAIEARYASERIRQDRFP